MLKCFVLALAMGVSALGAQAENLAEFLGSYVWTSADSDLGGLSGFEISEDGRSFHAVSDSATLFRGTFQRASGKQIKSISDAIKTTFLNKDGAQLKHFQRDAEGLAIASNGAAFMSFEGTHQVVRFDERGGQIKPLKSHADFKSFQRNSSLEALAVDAMGRLFTFPERSGSKERPFPVYMFSNNAGWKRFGTLPRQGEYLLVGADFGPDGKLYTLERWFSGVSFSSRVTRYDQKKNSFVNGQEILRTPFGAHDNLEGLAVWESEIGTHLTMVSDDNFKFFQKTEFVDYLIPK